MAQKDILEVRQLRKQIGVKRILKDVSFKTTTGELLAITGSNGTGKTTLMRILAGLLPKSGGDVLWNDTNLNLNHGRIGYISHKPMLYETLSVQENLTFFGQMYGTMTQKWVQELLNLVGLWIYRLEPAAVLSRGMQQRLALARALIVDPSLILYDEPFTSLDPESQRLLRQILRKSQSKAIQIVITHELSLLDGLPFREIRLQDGLVMQGGLGDA